MWQDFVFVNWRKSEVTLQITVKVLRVGKGHVPLDQNIDGNTLNVNALNTVNNTSFVRRTILCPCSCVWRFLYVCYSYDFSSKFNVRSWKRCIESSLRLWLLISVQSLNHIGRSIIEPSSACANRWCSYFEKLVTYFALFLHPKALHCVVGHFQTHVMSRGRVHREPFIKFFVRGQLSPLKIYSIQATVITHCISCLCRMYMSQRLCSSSAFCEFNS